MQVEMERAMRLHADAAAAAAAAASCSAAAAASAARPRACVQQQQMQERRAKMQATQEAVLKRNLTEDRVRRGHQDAAPRCSRRSA